MTVCHTCVRFVILKTRCWARACAVLCQMNVYVPPATGERQQEGEQDVAQPCWPHERWHASVPARCLARTRDHFLKSMHGVGTWRCDAVLPLLGCYVASMGRARGVRGRGTAPAGCCWVCPLAATCTCCAALTCLVRDAYVYVVQRGAATEACL